MNPFVGAIRDTIPTAAQAKADAVNKSNIDYADRIATQFAPTPRIIDSTGKVMTDVLAGIKGPPSYNDLYGEVRKTLPSDVMPDIEKIANDAQGLNDKFQMENTARYKQLQQVGLSDKEIMNMLAKHNPQMIGPMMDIGLTPSPNNKGFSMTKAAVAAGGYGGYRYVKGLMKYVPQGKEIVRELGESGYRMRGYDNVGNPLRGDMGKRGPTLKTLTLEELTDKKGPYKFSKTKANEILKARKAGPKALQTLATGKNAISKNIVKALIRAGKTGKLVSAGGMASGVFSWPSLIGFAATSALLEGGEWMLDKLSEGE